MSDLAPFVAAVLRDGTVADLKEENADLKKENERLRNLQKELVKFADLVTVSGPPSGTTTTTPIYACGRKDPSIDNEDVLAPAYEDIEVRLHFDPTMSFRKRYDVSFARL